jgi:hypothetical protein
MQAGEGQPGANSRIDLIPSTPRAGREASRSQTLRRMEWLSPAAVISAQVQRPDRATEWPKTWRLNRIRSGSPSSERRGHGLATDASEPRPHLAVADLLRLPNYQLCDEPRQAPVSGRPLEPSGVPGSSALPVASRAPAAPKTRGDRISARRTRGFGRETPGLAA